MRCRHCGVEIERLDRTMIYTGNPGYETVEAWVDADRRTYCPFNDYHEPELPPTVSVEEAITGLQGIVEDLT